MRCAVKLPASYQLVNIKTVYILLSYSCSSLFVPLPVLVSRSCAIQISRSPLSYSVQGEQGYHFVSRALSQPVQLEPSGLPGPPRASLNLETRSSFMTSTALRATAMANEPCPAGPERTQPAIGRQRLLAENCNAFLQGCGDMLEDRGEPVSGAFHLPGDSSESS